MPEHKLQALHLCLDCVWEGIEFVVLVVNLDDGHGGFLGNYDSNWPLAPAEYA